MRSRVKKDAVKGCDDSTIESRGNSSDSTAVVALTISSIIVHHLLLLPVVL